ncbi:hypothetical protein H0E87_026788, partial [Populus deltoides]
LVIHGGCIFVTLGGIGKKVASFFFFALKNMVTISTVLDALNFFLLVLTAASKFFTHDCSRPPNACNSWWLYAVTLGGIGKKLCNSWWLYAVTLGGIGKKVASFFVFALKNMVTISTVLDALNFFFLVLTAASKFLTQDCSRPPNAFNSWWLYAVTLGGIEKKVASFFIFALKNMVTISTVLDALNFFFLLLTAASKFLTQDCSRPPN